MFVRTELGQRPWSRGGDYPLAYIPYLMCHITMGLCYGCVRSPVLSMGLVEIGYY